MNEKPKLRRIAIVNNREIWTDKKGITSIDDGVLTFKDGSTCDANAGIIENRGSGTIEIRGPRDRKDEKDVVVGPKIFSAIDLKIDNVDADVTVLPGTPGCIEVTISGPESACESILLKERGETLVISPKAPSPFNIGSCSSKNVVNICGSMNVQQNIGRNSINGVTQIINIEDGADCMTIINGDCSVHKRAKVEVKVPVGTSITAFGVKAGLTIGDIEGSLDLDTDSNENISVGFVKDADLSIDGCGNVRVKRVEGGLKVELNGSGDVRIDSGLVRNMIIQHDGQGQFDFLGKSDGADLNVLDSGSICVAEVNGELLEGVIEGSGSITVKDGNVVKVRVNNEDCGDFIYNGSTADAVLTVEDCGDIKVKACRNTPRTDREGCGRISVGNW